MSRYLVEGIRRDLNKGLRVGVVAHTMVGGRAVFAAVAEAMKDDAQKVYKANGNERITTKEGGEFRVFSRQSKGLRGVSLDVLVIADRGAYTYEQYSDLMEEVLSTLDTSANSELISA